MSVTVEISNSANLQRVKSILGAKTDNEAAELALEKVIEVCEPKSEPALENDLPEEYWNELFSEPQIPSHVIDKIIREEREDRF